MATVLGFCQWVTAFIVAWHGYTQHTGSIVESIHLGLVAVLMSLFLLLIGYLLRHPRTGWMKWLWFPIVLYAATGVWRIVLVDVNVGWGDPDRVLATVEGWAAAGQVMSGWPLWLLLMSGLYYAPNLYPDSSDRIETKRGSYRFVWYVCLAILLFVLVSLAGSPLAYLDGTVLFSFTTLLFVLVLSGMRWSDVPRFMGGLVSIRLIPRNKLEEYRYFARRTGHVSVLLGAFVALIGLVVMLGNLDSPDRLGPSMAVTLLGLFYGLALKLFVFDPYGSLLNIILEESTDDG